MDTESKTVEIVWRVAPEDNQRWSLWQQCRSQWLNATERRSGRTHTRRAYDHDFNAFFLHFQVDDLLPWQVTRSNVGQWVADMAEAGLAPATINRRLAALSSFYRYATSDFATAAGPLWTEANPFGSRQLRYRVDPYGRSVNPSPDQVAAMLRQIDTSSIVGQRNLALLGGLFVTTRRVSEWVTLRWGQIHTEQVDAWFEYTAKGGHLRRQAIPAPIWGLMLGYLRGARRWGQLSADDYVFVAHSEAARRLPGARPAEGRQMHLAYSSVNKILRRLGKLAGVPLARCHAHGLRFAGLQARQDSGADLLELCDTAGHANVATTQIYVERQAQRPVDARGEAISALVLPRSVVLSVARDR